MAALVIHQFEHSIEKLIALAFFLIGERPSFRTLAGGAVILAAVIFVGYRMWATECGVSIGLELIVLAVMPAVYIVLMYLTLTSQK